MSEKIPLELIANELSESDLDSMIWMGMNIELKLQEEIEPALAEILSYFRCERCGECCRSNPPGVSDEELVAIAKKTGKEEAFDALDENVLMNAFRSPCRFLSGHGCKIYETRPRVCRLYPFSLKNMGFITLVLCPLGKEIQKELENFIRSKGITKVRYEHNPEMQKVEDALNEMREISGFQKGTRTIIQVGLLYGYVPLFLKYLRHKKT